MKKILLIFSLTISSLIHATAQIPSNTRQIIIGIAPTEKSSHAILSMFEREENSHKWTQRNDEWKARLGRNGLAWGIGIHPRNIKGPIKKEGDGRSPSGIFKIGSESKYAFGYASVIKKLPQLPYKQITTKDLWVEDSNSPYYNQHLHISHQPKTTWEKKAQMRQGDHAHSLKLFIAHNEGTAQKRAIPNAGSSIFFHIWRGGGTKPTAGCTTMSEPMLKNMISKIDPKKNPVYVLLTAADYQRFRVAWKLP